MIDLLENGNLFSNSERQLELRRNVVDLLIFVDKLPSIVLLKCFIPVETG